MKLINTYLILPVYDLYIIKGNAQSINKKNNYR